MIFLKSQSENPSLPDDILDHMILPRLPFKTLKRFQCVSKKYRSLIGHDPLFPSEQARLLSPSSTDLIHLSRDGGLSVLINPETIGIPDPSLQSLRSLSVSNLLLICSTNGLLLFFGCFEASQQWLCLCNPATQEKQFVPTYGLMLADLHDVRNTGLAFDPSTTPNRYILVNPDPDTNEDGYRFDIFQSDSGKWRSSNKRVHVRGGEYSFSLKRVYIQGVIYWHYLKYILWYNTENDLAGYVPLPITEESHYWSMGVYEDEVVCCHSLDTGVEVWRLTNGTLWDRLHFISWDNIPLQVNRALLKTALCEQQIKIFKSQFSRPFAFDGQFVYLQNFQNMYSEEANTKVGSYVQIGDNMDLLGYNIFTQQLENKGQIFVTIFERDVQAYDYHNSMAPLPKILR